MFLKHIPNFLCVFRILSAFLTIILFAHNYTFLALGIAFLGAISDFFDGYIARKYNVESETGALLDPLADKVFSNSILWGIWFICPERILFIIAIILTVKDCILIIGSFLVLTNHSAVSLKPLLISKVCTTVVFLYIICCVIFTPANKFVICVGVCSIILIVLTAIKYAQRYMSSKKNQN